LCKTLLGATHVTPVCTSYFWFFSILGYKSLEVANRHVDAYLHVTEIKKWDICAGNAIINFLGGKMTTLSNELLYYSSEDDTINKKGLLATMEKHELYLEKLKPFML